VNASYDRSKVQVPDAPPCRRAMTQVGARWFLVESHGCSLKVSV